MDDSPASLAAAVRHDVEPAIEIDLDPVDSVVVTTLVRLFRGGDRVEFRTVVENGARDHRLRVVFPLAATVGPVRAEGQFALVRRALEGLRPRTVWAAGAGYVFRDRRADGITR